MSVEVIEVEYSQVGGYGYEEDTWKMSSVIKNKHDLFRFMRKCYNRDAHNRTNYPLNGFVDGTFTYYRRKYETCNLGHNHFISEQKFKSEWHDQSWKDFCQWREKFKLRVSKRHERLQDAKAKAEELALYNELKSKYEA